MSPTLWNKYIYPQNFFRSAHQSSFTKYLIHVQQQHLTTQKTQQTAHNQHETAGNQHETEGNQHETAQFHLIISEKHH